MKSKFFVISCSVAGLCLTGMLGLAADKKAKTDSDSRETVAKPMTEKEMRALEAKCKSASGDGRFELYKVSLRYDNPVTRLPHGFPIDPSQKEVKEMLKAPFGTWVER